jgi:hypothetical protein
MGRSIHHRVADIKTNIGSIPLLLVSIVTIASLDGANRHLQYFTVCDRIEHKIQQGELDAAMQDIERDSRKYVAKGAD